MKNIVLIGLPGCGKTTLGRKLADLFKMNFIDLDSVIEQKLGMPITEIFAKYGEDHFRRAETAAAAEAASLKNTVISCGGGIVLREENMSALRRSGVVAFIDRDPAAISKDIQTEARPLMKNDPNRILQLHKQRLPLYATYSDYRIENKNKESALSCLQKITQTSKREFKLAVIGDPVSHSLSPDLHLPVLNRLCANAVYERVTVKKGELQTWINRVRNEGYDGFNITMPHKSDILTFLDEIDDAAARVRSVNSVTNLNGKLIGYSTDGNGFVTSVQGEGYSFADKSIVLLGAGGAASILALKIASEKPNRIVVLARTAGKAKAICENIKSLYPQTEVQFDDMTDNSLNTYCAEAQILINATPLGMKNAGSDFENFNFLTQMKKDTLVCDLIYYPIKTRLLAEAQALGLYTLGGLGMLMDQAFLADEIFIGHAINLQSMRHGAAEFIKRKVEEQ